MRGGKRLAGLAMVLCLFFLFGQCMAQQDDDYFVTKDQLKALLDSPDMTLIDMRFGRDWTDAMLKIKGAVREDPMKPGMWMDKYPKDKILVFY